MEVGVIVATVGRPALLRRLLEALLQQDLAPERFEISIAIDGRDAATVALLQEFAPRFQHLRWTESEVRQGPAAARNRAWQAVSAPIVAMTDDDCEPDPQWLSAMLAHFDAHPEIGVVLGRTVTDRSRVTPFSHYVENLAGEGHQTCNSAYRRSVLEQLGGFDTAFPMAYLEDTDLFCRAEAITQVAFEPAAGVVHPPREANLRDIVRSARKFESDFIFFRKSPELYLRRHEGKGPVASVAWDVATKHALKQIVVHRRWLRIQPSLYLCFACAQLLFGAALLLRVPGFWLRYQRGAHGVSRRGQEVRP